MIQEGVTQYQLDWRQEPLDGAISIETLNHWRSCFFALELIGQSAERYDGIGFGNVSQRLNTNEFLISGTQTGAYSVLTLQQYCRVLECDIEKNQVRAAGPVPPSSEAMTHDMIYRLLPWVNYVFHLHAPSLWLSAQRLAIPCTPAEVGYGTPAMAASVRSLIEQTNTRVIAMAGHEDGVIGWGDDANVLGEQLLLLYNKATGRQV